MTRDELRAEWIRRLESGEYEQGRTNLRCNDAYCCLGIACEILVEEGVLEAKREGGATTSYVPVGGLDSRGSTTLLPDPAVEAFGLRGRLGEVHPDEYKNEISLTSLNDNGVPFPEIAKRLRTGDYWKE